MGNNFVSRFTTHRKKFEKWKKEKTNILIRVGEVTSPHDLFVQLNDDEKDLEILMDKLE